jgi:xylulokinase
MRSGAADHRCVLGVDIGTSSSKGVVVDLRGHVLGEVVLEHDVNRPGPGMVEMDAQLWWDEFVNICRELLDGDVRDVVAVGVSGMGPCVCLTDEEDRPLRPTILYGVDTRAGTQIARLNERYSAEAILRRGGSALSSQSAGPKIAWVAEEEPEVYARARRLYMPSSWLVNRLTGEYVLDHHSASQCTPLYDMAYGGWYSPWAEDIAPGIELPGLRWAGERAGVVSDSAADASGLPAGVPVAVGTIDAWAEALSVGAERVGDLFLMYGTTMFLIHTVAEPMSDPSLWGTVGTAPGTACLAAGMAASGAVTRWLRDLLGGPEYAALLEEARDSGVGANGLVMLPYFAGERTPLMDPDARGVIAGLNLTHTRGDLYRAALEATAFGTRHNIEAIQSAGGRISRVVAAGGGTQGSLWPQVVSDVTGLAQEVREQSIGASYGAAVLAARLVADVSIDDWNPIREVLLPNASAAASYDALYGLFRRLYTDSAHVTHALSAMQSDWSSFQAVKRSPE